MLLSKPKLSNLNLLHLSLLHHSPNSNQFVVDLKGCGHVLILLSISNFFVRLQIIIMLQLSKLKKLTTLPLSHPTFLTLKICGVLSTKFSIANLLLFFQHYFPLPHFLQCLQPSSPTKYTSYVTIFFLILVTSLLISLLITRLPS